MKKELSFVDYAKLAFAVGVVAIHAGCFSSNGLAQWLMMHGALRLAVPFFFCTTGYFFYRSLEKSDNNRITTIKYIKRLIAPFVFWLILNLPFVIYGYLSSGNSIIMVLIKILRGLVFYPWGAMWFISASIVAILLIIPFYKKRKLKNAVVVGLVLYLIGLLFNTYYFVVDGSPLQPIIDTILKIVSSMRNGVFEGLFFVSVGMYISELQAERKISSSRNILVLVSSYLLLLIEIILTKNMSHADDHSLFIMFIVVIPSLFVFLSGLPSLKRSTTILRNYSTGIYFSHRFFLALVTLIIGSSNSFITFLLTLSSAVVLLSVLYKIDNKKINYLIK